MTTGPSGLLTREAWANLAMDAARVLGEPTDLADALSILRASRDDLGPDLAIRDVVLVQEVRKLAEVFGEGLNLQSAPSPDRL